MTGETEVLTNKDQSVCETRIRFPSGRLIEFIVAKRGLSSALYRRLKDKKNKKASDRMCTTRLPTVSISVTATMYQYHWWGRYSSEQVWTGFHSWSPDVIGEVRYPDLCLVGDGGTNHVTYWRVHLILPTHPCEKTDTCEHILILSGLCLRVVNISHVVFPFDSKSFIFCTKGNFTEQINTCWRPTKPWKASLFKLATLQGCRNEKCWNENKR